MRAAMSTDPFPPEPENPDEELTPSPGEAPAGEPDSGLAHWKASLRRDFEAWLDSVDGIPDPAAAPDPLEEPDLCSFFEQLALATAESRKANRRAAEAFSQWGETLAHFEADLRLLREQMGRMPAAGAAQAAPGRAHCLALVELLDRMRRLALAFRSAPEKPWWRGSDAAWRKAWESQRRGLEILLGHFEDLLAREGVSPVDCIGQPFDPTVMAAAETAADAGRPHNTVIEEIAPGYRLRGELLRPAQVKVAVNRIRSDDP
jgi:molecular chaperone GrpE (heat shock protein)